MNKNKFILPNAIPYVNAKPHIGHAMEFVQSDTIARFHKQQGEEVLLLCGADENALKNVQAAEQEKFLFKNWLIEIANSLKNLPKIEC